MADEEYGIKVPADELAPSPPHKKRRGVRATSESDNEASKPARRSARASKFKKRDETPQESLRASPTPMPTPKSRASTRKKVEPKTVIKEKKSRRVKEDVFNEPDRLFGPQKSLLYKDETDLTAILRSQKAIEILSSTDHGYPFLDAPKENLQYYVERFKTEGAEGYHDSEWLNEALAATEGRAAGLYDSYLEAKFREEWGDDENEYYTDTEDEKDAEAAKEVSTKIGNEEAKVEKESQLQMRVDDHGQGIEKGKNQTETIAEDEEAIKSDILAT